MDRHHNHPHESLQTFESETSLTMGSISIVAKSHDDDGRRQFFKKKAVTQLAISVLIFFSFFVVVLLVCSRNMYSCSFDVISRRLSLLLHAVFSRSIDKKCVFLLCNGLLVFVASKSSSSGSLINTTTSSSSSSPPQIVSDNDCDARYYDESRSEQEVEEIKEVVMVEGSSVVGGHDQEQVAARGDEGKIVGKEKLQESEDGVHEEEDEEDDDDEEGEGLEEEEGIDAVLSTEELNRKFDEFIRRMKEEIRVEAQRHCQLVLVK